MFSPNDKCILCIKTTKETIKIFGDRGRDLKIAETLSNHFWFRVEEYSEDLNGICNECWQKTESFDKFYKSIQEAHSNLLDRNVENNDDTETVKSEIIEYLLGDFKTTSFIPSTTSDELAQSQNHSTAAHDECRTTETSHRKQQSKRTKFTKTKVSIDDSDNKFDSCYAMEMEDRMGDFFEMDCDVCAHRFGSWNDAKTHYQSAHNIRKAYLKCCNKKFFLRSRIIDHITWHIDSNAFQCTRCSKKFTERRTLTAHNLRHLEDEKRNFQCNECHKRFSRRHILNRHLIDVHPTGNQKFICDICQKNFKSEHILKTHILKVHDRIDQRICDVCAKVFKTKEGFHEHMISHMGIEEPRVQCRYCGAWLKNRGSLNKHIKLHTDSPQECEICHKIKPTRAALNHHKRVVHGDAIHQCTICDKTFKRLLVLTEHIASHTGENLYQCPYCSQMFKSNSNMHKHRKQAHFEQWAAEREAKKNAFFAKS